MERMPLCRIGGAIQKSGDCGELDRYFCRDGKSGRMIGNHIPVLRGMFFTDLSAICDILEAGLPTQEMFMRQWRIFRAGRPFP